MSCCYSMSDNFLGTGGRVIDKTRSLLSWSWYSSWGHRQWTTTKMSEERERSERGSVCPTSQSRWHLSKALCGAIWMSWGGGGQRSCRDSWVGEFSMGWVGGGECDKAASEPEWREPGCQGEQSRSWGHITITWRRGFWDLSWVDPSVRQPPTVGYQLSTFSLYISCPKLLSPKDSPIHLYRGCTQVQQPPHFPPKVQIELQ